MAPGGLVVAALLALVQGQVRYTVGATAEARQSLISLRGQPDDLTEAEISAARPARPSRPRRRAVLRPTSRGCGPAPTAARAASSTRGRWISSSAPSSGVLVTAKANGSYGECGPPDPAHDDRCARRAGPARGAAGALRLRRRRRRPAPRRHLHPTAPPDAGRGLGLRRRGQPAGPPDHAAAARPQGQPLCRLRGQRRRHLRHRCDLRAPRPSSAAASRRASRSRSLSRRSGTASSWRAGSAASGRRPPAASPRAPPSAAPGAGRSRPRRRSAPPRQPGWLFRGTGRCMPFVDPITGDVYSMADVAVTATGAGGRPRRARPRGLRRHRPRRAPEGPGQQPRRGVRRLLGWGPSSMITPALRVELAAPAAPGRGRHRLRLSGLHAVDGPRHGGLAHQDSL